MVTLSAADLLGSATEVAMIIAVTLLATLAGALYFDDMVVCCSSARPGECPGTAFCRRIICDDRCDGDGLTLRDGLRVAATETDREFQRVLVLPPQPERIVELRYPNAIKAIQEIFLVHAWRPLLRLVFPHGWPRNQSSRL